MRDILMAWSWWRENVHESMAEPLSAIVGMVVGGMVTFYLFDRMESTDGQRENERQPSEQTMIQSLVSGKEG
ncbi:hypothetical protein [Larkinella soli]|uniref:hypothetical protein n=1 Tax=Larkinella soli TaxID=1770527 RepID=UPI000FFCAAE9|nr:hypothetical protein [Larkinella soli]